MDRKKKEIETEIKKLCKLVGIQEATHELRANKLLVNEKDLLSRKEYKMKSKVQSYDIRDIDHYNGILELEAQLRETGGIIIDNDQIKRATSSKIFNIGSDGSYEESDSDSEKMDALDAFLLEEDADGHQQEAE